MKRYFKLLNFELTRFWKIYAALAAITALLQTLAVFLYATMKPGQIEQQLHSAISPGGESEVQPVQLRIIDAAQQFWYLAPIVLCVAVLLLYVFLIWYRDWLGKNTFVYRLLMLPANRSNLYFAKLAAILLLTLGLVGLQIVLLPLHNAIFNSLVPPDMLQKISLVELVRANKVLQLLIPQSGVAFLLNYGAGAGAVVALFAGILLERSYRWKGLAASVLYIALTFGVLAFPMLVFDKPDSSVKMYPIEQFILYLVLFAAITAVSIWLGTYLVRKKVTV